MPDPRPAAPPDCTAASTASAHPNTVLPLFLDVLRRRGHVTFMLADLHGRTGMAELDHGVIALDENNTGGEHVAAVVHELEHLADPDAVDDDVEQRAAQRLVPLPAAMTVLIGGADPATVADELGVDARLVAARVRGLADPETVVRGVG